MKVSKELEKMLVDVDELVQDPENERAHPVRNIAAIRASLATYGQQKPVVYHVRDGARVVIAGNGLLAAARSLGWVEVAAVEFKGSIDEARGFRVADNRTAELAEWDNKLLAETLKHFAEIGDDLFTATGFDDEDLTRLLESMEEPEPPPTFPKLDPSSLRVEYQCPKCGYEWSGATSRRKADEDDDRGPGAKQDKRR